MHRDHLVGNRYFVPFFVFYKSVMLGPRFIPARESIFYTQSVKCLVPVLHLSARVFCFVLYFPSHAVSDMFFLYLFYLRNKKKNASSVESLYHKDSNMVRRFNKVKPCSARVVLGWVTKYEYPVLQKLFFPLLFQGDIKDCRTAILV